MKFMLTVSLPIEEGNDLIRSGQLGPLLQKVLGDVKPEAVYFAPNLGTRAMFVVLDIADGSKIPAAIEPFFLGFGASVDITPVFTMEDMQKATSDLEALAKKY